MGVWTNWPKYENDVVPDVMNVTQNCMIRDDLIDCLDWSSFSNYTPITLFHGNVCN